MQAVEALTLLIALGDQTLSLNSTVGTDNPELSENEETLKTAISIAQAMLNTALPVARFRCFIKIESGFQLGREYTICSPIIEDIVAALYPLSLLRVDVYITLWEQRSTGADMLEGFQGRARSVSRPGLDAYLDRLRKYSIGHLAN